MRAILIIAGFILVGATAWVGRGLYDEIFMMEGRFHVISLADKDHDVVLDFPSGKRVELELAKGATTDFQLLNTGEGSITITVDGKKRDEVGYVTSINGTIVLTIAADDTGFSQIWSTPQGLKAD
jgi:hypothetical protein